MGIDKLREIGAHKIFEQTHIAKKVVEDILNGNYYSMNKVQFSGFISILEREYHVDLQELIEDYNAHFYQESAQEKEPFVVSIQENSEDKKHTTAYIVVAVVIAAILLAVYSLSSSPGVSKQSASAPAEVLAPQKAELNSTTIEEAKSRLNTLDETADAEEEIIPAVSKVIEEPVHIGKFEVIPRSNLWIGLIDLETFKRTQKLGSAPFELDAQKEWLLVMGHGYVNFIVNGEEQKYSDNSKVWFSYANGVLTKLTKSEFKEKNRGKAW